MVLYQSLLLSLTTTLTTKNKFLNIVDGGGTGRIGGMMSGLKDAESPSDN